MTLIKTTVETFCDSDTFVSYCELVEAQEQPADEFVGCGDYMKDVVYSPKQFLYHSVDTLSME